MGSIKHLLENNRAWAARCLKDDPNYFSELKAIHDPNYLWIGCSDARVPANTLLGLKSGEVFVHRNIANQVSHLDLNCLSVIQHAVEALQVKDIIVCGHYGCGGIQGALGIQKVGVDVDHWIRPIKDIYAKYRAELEATKDPVKRTNQLCELNVRAQVLHVCQTSFVRDAWSAGKELSVHGLIYSIEDGLLRCIDLRISSEEEMLKAGG